MSEKLLLEIIAGLLCTLIAIVAYLVRRHDLKHDELLGMVGSLLMRRNECLQEFATKQSVKRSHERIDEQQAQITELSERVTALESTWGR